MNLTLYWGRSPWQGPLSLRDMLENFEALPRKLRSLSGDYKVHLIHMRSIPESELEKMSSDLKYVLGIMKCTRSKRKYEEFIRKNRDYFSHIPRSAVDVIDVCTGIRDIMNCLEFTMNPESGEEEADMCKALNDIKKDAENKGIRQGLKEGTFITLCSLVKDGLLQLEEAARRTGLSEAAFRERMRRAGFCQITGGSPDNPHC